MAAFKTDDTVAFFIKRFGGCQTADAAANDGDLFTIYHL
jgi:hypothetical protein